MFGDITIGQYYPTNSVIHRLDPRVKFIGMLVYVVSIFMVRNYGYIVCAAYLFTLIGISRIPLKYMFKGLKALTFILVITVVLNVFMTDGTIIWQWKLLKITSEGLTMAFLMAVRLILLVLGISQMSLTTTPNQLTDAMERLFRPLNKIKVPVHSIAMMMSISLRFIPILSEETEKIKKAQMARGANFEGKGFMNRIRAMIPILVPLFVTAFRRATDLAMAMEARCYHGGEGRTQMKPLKYARRDGIMYLIMLCYLTVVIVFRILIHW